MFKTNLKSVLLGNPDFPTGLCQQVLDISKDLHSERLLLPLIADQSPSV